MWSEQLKKGGPLCHHTMAGIVQGRGGRGLTLTPLFAALPECPLSRMFNLDSSFAVHTARAVSTLQDRHQLLPLAAVEREIGSKTIALLRTHLPSCCAFSQVTCMRSFVLRLLAAPT